MKSSFLPLIIASILLILACERPNYTEEVREKKPSGQSLAEWQANKFSMFIHWGVYAIPAGVWEGKQISGYSEQIKGHAVIPTEEYRKLAKQFKPEKWRADSIALLAKQSGMKSIVITAKHHDGFSLFDTQYSTFDVVDATPYGKDIVKEIAEACKRHGLKLGLYFSLIDWDFRGATPFVSTRNSDTIPPAHHQYNLYQVEELLTNYGPISEMWFDMGAPTLKQSKDVRELVKEIQPSCLVSGRIWNDQGDFVVMGDNYQPNFRMGVPWQTPASMFDETWSYRSWQKREDVQGKIREKILDLLNIVSAGGNYLLNIGPKADGSVVPYERDVLKGVGKWLNKNGEAIYGSQHVVGEKPDWGYLTANGNKLYLHVVDFPENDTLELKGIQNKAKRIAPLLQKDVSLACYADSSSLYVVLNDSVKQDRVATVFVLEHEGKLAFKPKDLLQNEKGEGLSLTPEQALTFHSYSGADYYTTQPTVVKLRWNIELAGPASYTLFVKGLPANQLGSLVLEVRGKSYPLIQNGPISDLTLESGQVIAIEIIKDKSLNPHKELVLEGLELVLRPKEALTKEKSPKP